VTVEKLEESREAAPQPNAQRWFSDGYGQTGSSLVADAGAPSLIPSKVGRITGVLASEDVRLARMKDLRQDAVSALGTMFFQRLPDELLRRLVANPPKTVEELRDEFELHIKIVENFGMRILSTVNAIAAPPLAERLPQIGTPIVRTKPGKREQQRPSQPPRVSQKMASVERQNISRAKVGGLHGSAVEARFERLRMVRLRLASKNHWPAYCVLQNATMLEIARLRPRTMRELLEIKGMGPKRAENFGKELLAELAKE
jgi:ribonuclease D